MKKVIRLTESDLTRLIKRVVMEQRDETKIGLKAEKLIHTPKVEMKIEDVFSNLSEEDKQELSSILNQLGIDENSSIEEIYRIIQNKVGEYESHAEMTEGEEMSPRKKAAEIFDAIGAGNLKLFGGFPVAVAIGGALAGTVGSPVAAGLAISWGASTLLLGLAKLLAKDEDKKIEESFKRRSKKKVRLSERQLTKMIKQVVSEQESSQSDDYIEKDIPEVRIKVFKLDQNSQTNPDKIPAVKYDKETGDVLDSSDSKKSQPHKKI